MMSKELTPEAEEQQTWSFPTSPLFLSKLKSLLRKSSVVITSEEKSTDILSYDDDDQSQFINSVNALQNTRIWGHC